MKRTARNSVSVAALLALIALAVAAFGAGSASAFGITSWEAGTCAVGTCAPENATPASNLYSQAAGHPNFGVTDFSVQGEEGNQVSRVKVELPPGLNVNPQAVSQCAEDAFVADSCPADSEVGVSEVTTAPIKVPVLGEILPVQIPAIGPLKFPVYDLTPRAGEPALFAFHVSIPVPILEEVVNEYVYLETAIEWGGDYHESFFIKGIKDFPPLGRNRLVFDGRAGNGSFLTLPSPCNGNSTSFLELEGSGGAVDGPRPSTPAVPISGCQKAPFAPTVTANSGAVTDSSATTAVSLNVPQHPGGDEINTSTVKNANVTLPVGAALNPATATGLKFCPDSAFPLKGKGAIGCPAESQIGTIAIEAPELPAGVLQGPVYLATQKSRDPQSGQEYRIFFNAEADRPGTDYGVQVREEGKVRANPVNGQLSAEFNELPQVAFSSATLTFGPTAKHAIPALSSPQICTQSSVSTAVPWSTGAPTQTAPTAITLTKAPGGGPCAKTLGERPFVPTVTAKPVTSKALSYTPFQLTIARPEGQQELKAFNLTLPPGATAKLAGVPYCQANEYNAAAGKSGIEEQKKSSCNPKSEIGVATILSGTGSTPLKIEGKAYLSGPYKGDPLSIVAITPAVAGPFDLGNVVVHAPLGLDPETARVSTSAEIPDVFGGARLDIRFVFININRKQFTLNGTNCNKGATTGNVQGGGGDPTNPAAWSSVAVNAAFQGTDCEALGFKPNLKVRLFGQTRRAKHPKLKATLTTQEGQANVALASVGLPHSIFLDQSSLGTVCTRPQFAAGQCPAKSRYGYARAWTPLLGSPVEGPVYLRSSNNTLPDMVADLHGQVNIVLDGKIDTFKGGIRTTFANVPDVPVSKFVLNLPGGKHGLLQASTNLCAKPVKGVIGLVGQNGKKANRQVRIQTPCKHRHPKKKHAKKHKGKGGKKAKGKAPGKKSKGGNKKSGK
jgi:hypothetical protein